MPPALSRKRLRSDSPPVEPSAKRTRVRNPPARRSKDSVFQTLDAPPKVRRTLSQTKAFLEQQNDDSESSEAESSDDEFEDVPLGHSPQSNGVSHHGQGDDSEGNDWEDALDTTATTSHTDGPEPVISDGIALTMSKYTTVTYDKATDGKKGPSKRQRQVRNATHCIHVQSLMFHNLMRNAWVQDEEVQKTLVSAMPYACWREVEQYWRDAGIQDGPARAVFVPDRINDPSPSNIRGKGQNWKDTGKNGVKIFEKSSAAQDKKKASKSQAKDRNARDWGAASEPLEPSVPNLSAGDPLMRLLRYLSAYWKSKFKVTVPSLRKRGYLSPMVLEAEVKAWQVNPNHPDIFGERIKNLDAFREVARRCEGSRDVAHQLFTALLRGLGIEARMIASLQPVGFGFSQAEEGKPKNLQRVAETSAQVTQPVVATPTKSQGKKPQRAATKDMPIVLDSDDSDLSSAISISSDGDKGKTTKIISKQRQSTDDLPFPSYWTEAISNLTHTPIAVATHPRGLIASASSEDKLQDFYARGAAADKARQVLAYIIGFSSDGTAKDVTTRYLPKHQWPGRTKGFRFLASKLPIHNRRGKVVAWEEWNWFRTMIQPYTRPHNKRLPWDEVEDEGDLVPAEPEKKKTMEDECGKETLQGYKNSTEFVLERHLRREEALKSGAKVVRQFVTKKGSTETSEPVYRRKDIVNCKTVESWHKEGREIKEGEQPLKFVPIRAVTVTRKREIEERQREDGVKPQQGLYARTQTDWIIPPPIVDGKIPRNAFNNIDVYVPTMVPQGAVHVPLKGTAKICRKLNIDHAEACTGFEFGKQRAVPVLTGVVVAAEHEDMVIDAWEEEEVAKAHKQAEKREKLVLSLWKKFLSSLRIIERMRAEYGYQEELPPKRGVVADKKTPNQPKSQREIFDNQEDFEGGFFREEPAPQQQNRDTVPVRNHNDGDMAEGLFATSQEEPVHDDLVIDHGEEDAALRTPASTIAQQTPISLTSALMRADEHGSMASLSDPPSHSEHEKESSSKPRRAKKKTKAVSARKRLTAIIHDPEDAEKAPEDAPDVSVTRSTRSAPRRRAARKSDVQVKSHYFAEGSDDETDLTDITDRMSPNKKAPAKRGRNGKAKKI